MPSESEIEKEIQAKGLNAPRLTPQMIEEKMKASYTFRASNAVGPDVPMSADIQKSLSCLTIAVVVLQNGYVVTGESACASPENFDADIGAKIALDNARKKIWALEGYLLRDQLAAPEPLTPA